MTTFLLYLLIPTTSAVIGWATNWVAVKMMFYPLEFVGKPPLLGWQGVIPANAGKMAGVAIDLLVDKLLSLEEIFARLDARRMTDVMGQHLDHTLEQIIDEMMLERAPRTWEMLPLWAKKRVYQGVRNEAPKIIEQTMDDLKHNITEIFDVRTTMTKALSEDKELLNEMFQKGADKEFEFLIRSGFYFGFLFGIPSMLVWSYFQVWWTLPLGGLMVGYVTNWLAIKMLFNPQQPQQIGPFVVHGLFLRRQQEVSVVYADIFTNRLLSAEKISDAMLHGPSSDKLFGMFERHLNRVIDETAGLAKPGIVLGIGAREFIAMKAELNDKLIEHAPRTTRYIQAYADEALDIENTLCAKMQSLTSAEFEGVLRPAYEQDEWKVAAVGGALGLVAGWLQYLLLV